MINESKGGNNMDKVTNENYLQELFIDEVKGCLSNLTDGNEVEY